MSALKANEEAWTLPGWQSRVSAENLGQVTRPGLLSRMTLLVAVLEWDWRRWWS